MCRIDVTYALSIWASYCPQPWKQLLTCALLAQYVNVIVFIVANANAMTSWCKFFSHVIRAPSFVYASVHVCVRAQVCACAFVHVCILTNLQHLCDACSDSPFKHSQCREAVIELLCWGVQPGHSWCSGRVGTA